MIRYLIIPFVVLLAGCSTTVTHIAQVDPEYYRIDNRQDEDHEEVEALISPYKSSLDISMNRVIGIIEKDIAKDKPNGPLNNWVADVILDEARLYHGEVDFAVQNYGGIRIPALASGDITVGKVYELMPFDNLISVISANGHITKQLLDRIADYGGWPISKNLTFTIANGEATDIMINGENFDPEGMYTFALPDYIANGGDDCYFLSEAERVDLDLLIRDAMIHHIENNGNMVKYNNEIRIHTR